MKMKAPWLKLTASLTAAALLFSGCGEPAPVEEEAAPPPDDTGEIVITGNDQMQFDRTEFTVQAGSEVTVVFRNVGQMPKETMGHNLAILTMGTDPDAFSAAAMRHAANEYIDPEREDEVIAATAVLGPGEEETLTFTAPEEPGEYPYVCSFPGHTPAGMKGIMTVE